MDDQQQAANPEGEDAGQPEAPVDPITQLLARLVAQDQARNTFEQARMAQERERATQEQARAVQADEVGARQRVRPKTINCRMFKLGENWTNFSKHFVECVKAAHGFRRPAEDDELYAECLSWLPSKLEPGPTFIAYGNLTDDQTATWDALDAALTDIFLDETEKETFLADIASFKRGTRSLLEYRNELMRLMTTHKSDLDIDGPEFQRQVTSRFIEGLADEELKRDLRRYCRRVHGNLTDAYERVVDYESSEAQSRIRSGEANFLSSIATANNGGDASPFGAEFQQLRNEVEDVASRQEETDAKIRELAVTSAHISDRVDKLLEGMEELSVRMSCMEEQIGGGFDELKAMMFGQGYEGWQ